MSVLKYLSIFVIILISHISVIAQTDSLEHNKYFAPTSFDSIDDDQPHVFASQMPVFAEGDYRKFIAKNIVYPQEAEKKGIQGKVYVKFIVEKDGTISDVKIIKSIHPSLDEEAIRVIKLTNGKWTPGYFYSGTKQPTRVYYNSAIDFVLRIKDKQGNLTK